MKQSTFTTPASELRARQEKLQRALQEKGFDGALIVQKTDLFYFSGTAQTGWLYVPDNGEPLLMITKDFDRAKAESALTQVVSLLSPKGIPDCLRDFGHGNLGRLGLELDVMPVNQFRSFQKIFPATQIEDCSTEIRLIRAVKSGFEIEKIRRAAQFSDKVAAFVKEILAPGKTEVTVAGELEAYARSLGHQGIVRMRMWNNELFYGHLMCGESAALPSYLASPTGGEGVSAAIGQGAGYRKIKTEEPVLVDYVFALEGYLSDHARIFCMGELSEQLKNAHDSMLEIQEHIKNIAKPGAITGDIYETMVQLAQEKGYGEHFMGVGPRRIRFTGHGVGLELDEFPFLAKGQKLPLKENMVIALEPKVIFPGIGVVGIENSHVVGSSGLEPLSQFPDSICEVNNS